MKLKNITIKNYKSIEEIKFEISKKAGSYTTCLVGVNETGKSNILEAMSFFHGFKEMPYIPDICNQNKDVERYIDISYEIVFEDREEYLDCLKKSFEAEDKIIEELCINQVMRKVHLEGEENLSPDNDIDFTIGNLSIDSLLFRKQEGYESPPTERYVIERKEKIPEDERQHFEPLDLDKLHSILSEVIDEKINQDIECTLWKPVEKHLISSEVDLNTFKENPDENIPLKNIFYLAGYTDQAKIKGRIEEISGRHNQLRKLERQLSSTSTKYFNSKWKELEVKIDFRISDGLICTASIQDKSKEDHFFLMSDRSAGFKQFASLIFTLSIQNDKEGLKNNLILIDEPELHLHPSAIRHMREELINIGKENYVFLATHSNFMVDNHTPKRNIIIKKNRDNNTYKKEIKDYNDMADDEVLKEAFGINVFKDFLTPNKILVEGKSDKLIIEKAIRKIDKDFDFAVSNGNGNNISSVASLLNFQKILALAIVDDDKSGKGNKKTISETGGIFKDNVFTIRDIEGGILEGGTTEDSLDRRFVISKFNEVSGMELKADSLREDKPIIKQIDIYLMKNSKTRKEIDKLIYDLKIKISEDFDPGTNLEQKMPLLYNLAKKIIDKLKSQAESSESKK